MYFTRFTLCFLLFSFFTPFSSFAKQTVQGRIFTDSGKSLNNTIIKIAQQKSTSKADGSFTIEVNDAAIYQLSISKKGYYPSVHTFSQTDINNLAKVLPDIYLTKKKKGRVMLAFGGDVMMGRRYYQPYFGDQVLIDDADRLQDSKAIVEHIKPYMELADYAAVNLETQIAKQAPEEKAKKAVVFYTRPEVLDALAWAGIDYVTLGNNHTYDYLESGLSSTLQHLNESAMDYSGAGKDAQKALTAHEEVINDMPFAMLGYVGWEGRGQTATKDHGGAAYGSMDNILSTVKASVNKEHVTIVQYHGSHEYANEPTGVTEQRLKSALSAGASLAVAHHPHVSQGLELYQNKLIAYSMGNFIFDQNFSATQHSFILYVWLDEGEFHRAEVVPVYLKGYKPTPATGIHRNYVMKRIAQLSKKRHTYITPTGGHGMISKNNSPPAPVITNKEVALTDGERVIDVQGTPWHQTLAKVTHEGNNQDNTLAYRLGVNLINGSDFESFATFNSNERGWLFDREKTVLKTDTLTGNASLLLKNDSSKATWFGMQSFRRLYKASSPMTLKTKLKVEQAVKVNVYWQGRKTRQKLFDAFNNAEKHLISSNTFTQKSQWQNLEIDFNSPRIGYKSFRVLLELIPQNGEGVIVEIDDFSLIEWQSAYRTITTPSLYNFGEQQATFIGFEQTTKQLKQQPIQLTFK